MEKKLSGDVLFTITLLLKAKNAVYCDAPIYRYYQSENSIQRNSRPENLSKLAKSSTFQLIHFTTLLKDLKNDLGAESPVYDKLRQKRDINVFYLILRLAKNNYPKSKILKVYDVLKENNVLPIEMIEDENFRSPHHKVLNFSLKHRLLLGNLLSLSGVAKALKK